MKRDINRLICAAFGIAILMGAGTVYAWSVIQRPIAAFFPQWTAAQLSLTFTLCMCLFCIGGFAGGTLIRKIKPTLLVCTAGILMFLGFTMASRAGSLPALYIGYGIMNGFASGVAYNVVMSVMSRRFADRQGMISGVMMMGFGISSFIVGKIYQAATPSGAGVEAWRNSLFVMGFLILIVYLVGSYFIYIPQNGAGAGAVTKDAKASEGVNMTTGQMLKRPSFWLFFAWAVLLSSVGLMLISQSAGIASEISPASSAETIATIVGLISIFNGLGRVCFGSLYDRAGRRKTIALVNICWFVSIALLIGAMLSKSFGLLVVSFIASGLSYGGVPPTNSAFISDFYGRENYPKNFSVVNLNLIFASFGGTIAGMLYDQTASYFSTILSIAVFAVIAAAASALIKKP